MILAAVLASTNPATITDVLRAPRILIVAAPSAADTRLMAQKKALRGADTALADRDVKVVEIAGDRALDTAQSASSLRRRWHLPAKRFAVVLIGKDGHLALRRGQPIATDALIAAIDAMPMRRAGLR